MTMADDIALIARQETLLVFARFGEGEAFALGALLREMALEESLPVIVDTRLWDRPLFFAALPGTAPANAEWARRKINSVRHYHKSSYRLHLEQGADGRVFGPDHGLAGADYAIAGGAFPIRLEGFGIVGAVAVSGLPQREDHDIVVRGLAAHLGRDGDVPRLAPDGG